MKLYAVIVPLSLLVAHAKAGPYELKCDANYSREHDYVRATSQQYDVTYDSFHIYSHDGYVIGSPYKRDYRRCIYIWTNMTDHVIKLEEKDFQLEYSLHCDEDNLTVYYTTFDDADDLNYEGLWCSDKGPKTKYSTANHMFLYFISNDLTTRRGFEFVVSGIYKDDVPGPGLSAGAIVGVVFGVLVLVVIISVIGAIVFLMWRNWKENPDPTNRNAIELSRTTTTTDATSHRSHCTVGSNISQPSHESGNNISPTPQQFVNLSFVQETDNLVPHEPGKVEQKNFANLSSDYPPPYDALYE